MEMGPQRQRALLRAAFVTVLAVPLLDRPFRMLLGKEAFSVEAAVEWTVGAMGFIGLVGLLFLMVCLASGPDHR
jgi:hypothetical protein